MTDESNLMITPTLVADQVSDVLQKAVFTGEFPAGKRLRVRDLAEMVGTSVMPVREAIRQLEQLGLATRIPHRGAVVREFTVAELIHIYDVRAILEVEATRRGVRGSSDVNLRQMEDGCASMLQAVVDGRVSDALSDDETILRSLYQAGGNPVLTSVIENLWVQCRAYKFIGAVEAVKNHDPSLWATQSELLKATRARDADAAALITEQSLDSARQRLEIRLAARLDPRSHPTDHLVSEHEHSANPTRS